MAMGVDKENGSIETTSQQKVSLNLVGIVALIFALFQLYTVGFGYFPNIIQRSIHLGFVLILAYGIYSVTKKSDSPYVKIPDYVCMVIVAFIAFHTVFHYWRIIASPFDSTLLDRIVGVLLIILLLEASRRTMGWIFVGIVGVLIVYAVAGPIFPGLLAHGGFKFKGLIESIYMTTHGMWGIVTSVSATIITTFVFFGTMLLYTGGGEAFLDISMLIAGRARGGGGKIAVVASVLFGTISGNSAANVATTGSFTIPMMIRLGYKRHFAAAVEAVASCGGQILPPVMGAGAFIMAELLGVPYLTICAAAVVPAIFYLVGVYFAVDMEARRSGYAPVPKEDIPSFREAISFKRIVPLVVPFGVFIILLLRGYTPDRCAFYAIILVMVLFLLFSKSFAELKKRFLTLVYALQEGAKAIITVAVLAASAQIVVSLITLTGLGIKLTEILVGITGQSLVLTLILAMVICVVLGMGTPTVAAYILASTVVSPALVKLGMEPIAAHLFIFYFAVFSAITPPVCTCVYVGAAIAKADWIKTAKNALMIGVPAFYIPYFFVNNHGILLKGNLSGIVIDCIMCFVGTWALAAALYGLMKARLYLWERIALVAVAAIMLFPGAAFKVAGVVIFAIVAFRHYLSHKDRDEFDRASISVEN